MRRGRRLSMARHGGFSYVGLLIGVALMGLVAYLLLQAYAPNKPVADRETQKALREEGLDGSSYKSALDSATQAINALGRRNQDVDF